MRLMRLPRPGRRLVAVALALSALVTVSACGRAATGSAAVVGETRISVNDLQTASTEIAGLFGERPGDVQRAVLGWMILGTYSVPIAEKYGVVVTEDEVRRAWAESPMGTEASDSPSSATIRALQGLVTLRRLNNLMLYGSPEKAGQAFTEIVERVKTDGLEVNPRYGTLRLDELTTDTLTMGLLQQSLQKTVFTPLTLPLTQESPDWLVPADGE
jgi:hypothetical protein